jgi:hypothetical protein
MASSCFKGRTPGSVMRVEGKRQGAAFDLALHRPQSANSITGVSSRFFNA